MRYLLESNHFDFFAKNGYIGFADLFTEDSLAAAQKIVSKNARDLWRSESAIKTLYFQKNCAGIAAALTHTNTIRIAYDQSLCSGGTPSFPKAPFSLEEASSVQPLLCAMIVRLTAGEHLKKPSIPYCPCPEHRGDALFVSGKMLIVLEPLLAIPNQKFLLVAYSGAKPQYVPKEKDPFVNSLKSLGVAFGDHLSHATHPVLFSQH